MLAQGCGKIINTASMASLLVPHPQKQAAYNASKAAGGWIRTYAAAGLEEVAAHTAIIVGKDRRCIMTVAGSLLSAGLSCRVVRDGSNQGMAHVCWVDPQQRCLVCDTQL